MKNQTKNEAIYPGEWQGGIPIGSIKENDKCFKVEIRAKKIMLETYKVFYFGEQPITIRKNTNNEQYFSSKEDALIAAKKFQMDISDKYNATNNKWRMIDANTIEVRLLHDTFITDYKYKDLIEERRLHAVKVHGGKHIQTKVGNKKYVKLCKLIKPDIKHIQYIDKNTLNLKESNLKEAGDALVSEKVIRKNEEHEGYDLNMDQYKWFKYIDLPYILPKNVWILGKPAGTVFEYKKRYNARISNACENDKNISKIFNICDNNKEEQYEKAKIWQYNTSYKMGLTKNLIRILDDKYIEVQITKGNVFITNIEFIPLIQMIPLFTTTGNSGRGDPYPGTSINGKNVMYHNLITGNDMTDHINRNTLDNRLENLRPCDFSINNSNKHIEKTSYMWGFFKNKIHLMTRIYINKKIHSKNFYIDYKDANKYDEKTKEKLKEKFVEIDKYYKQWMLHGVWNSILIPYITYDDYSMAKIHLDILSEFISLAILKKEDYFKKINIDLNENQKNMIYHIYISSYVELYQQYSDIKHNDEINDLVQR